MGAKTGTIKIIATSVLAVAGASADAQALQTIVIRSVITGNYYLASYDFETGFVETYVGGGGAEGTVVALAGAPYSSKSNDVRCNPGATTATRTTTSHAMSEDRFTAASQIAAFIAAQDQLLTLNAMLSQNPAASYNGSFKPVFTVKYADGGSEKWVVVAKVPVTLAIEPLPGLKLGDNVAKPCSADSGGSGRLMTPLPQATTNATRADYLRRVR